MANGALTHYDRPRIAQLCEKAGLYMRALQHYSDLPDIKRVIVNTHAIDPQQLRRVLRLALRRVGAGVPARAPPTLFLYRRAPRMNGRLSIGTSVWSGAFVMHAVAHQQLVLVLLGR